MASQFDKEGRYFAQLTDDGKLKIWSTASNSLDQEYIPDLHLTSPCTCLQFVDSWNSKNESPRKKKKRHSFTDMAPDIVLGTTSGKLIVYSITKGDVKCMINGELNLQISCVCPNMNELLYSGVEQNVVIWNLQQKTVINKWRCGNDKISAILAVPDTTKLLTGSKSIKLWNIENKTLLKTFRGHSSEVYTLQVITNVGFSEPKYVISGSKTDRLLNCWNISEDCKDADPTASLLMEDSVRTLSLNVPAADGSTKLAAAVGSGIVHVFQLALNGKCTRPVKPKSTIQVVSDTGQKNDAIIPISVVSTFFKNQDSLLIAHGSYIALTFEDVEINNKKLICLTRKSLQSSKKVDSVTGKILTPIVGNDVHYATAHDNVVASTKSKRKNDGKIEVPMEKRLENLSLDQSEAPKSGNMAQLLLQGLRSKDENIIKAVLCKRDEDVIRNTVKRLPLKVISQLIKELTNFIQGKTVSSQIGALWMRHLIQTHAALLISNPDLPDLLAPVVTSIENRLTLLSPLSRLKGRLDLLVSQLAASSSGQRDTEDEQAMLVFNDKDSSSDSDQEIKMSELLNSTSENEWSEEQSSDEEMAENSKSLYSDDEEMST